MTVLITMAGLGLRFKEQGYIPPKFRVKARGRTLMDWSLLSLQSFFDQRFIMACLNAEDGDWIRSAAKGLGIVEVIVAKRAGVSRGQAETAFDASVYADPSEPLWIYNIDTCVSPNAMRPQDLDAADGCIPVFQSDEANMSFIRYGSSESVVEVAEKRPISRWATVGLYGFRTASRFADCYIQAYDEGHIRITQGERYVAPMYQLMIERGDRVVAPRLNGSDVHILGTPAQVLAFDPTAQPPLGSRTLIG